MQTLADSACAGPVVVAKHSTRLPELSCDLWLEPDEPAHPLCGVVTALARARGPIVVVPCDVPFLPVALIDRLAGCAGAAVVESPRGIEPLLARYGPEALDVLGSAMASGKSARAAVTPLDPEVIRYDDELLNVNTPADLDLARSVVASG
jgi:molybdenum cofactor guanylyltransferase